MDNYTEIEKRLKETYEKIETDDFLARFEKIKTELKPKNPRKSNPIDEIRYIESHELTYKAVSEKEFYAELNAAKISPVQFSMGYASNLRLLTDEEQKIWGGVVEIYAKEDKATLFASVFFYDKTVRVNETLYADYNLSCKAGGADIKYKLPECLIADGAESFECDAYARHEDLFYSIKCYSILDNVTKLFDTLFGK